MDEFRIQGGRKLNGKVIVSGSKNAALPLMVASLLTEKTCFLKQVPGLQDTNTVLSLLEGLGVKVERDIENHQVRMTAETLLSEEAPYDWVRKMRASILVLGPLLARFGKAKVSLPGGCAIGARPVNYHLHGLEKLGASIEIEGGYICAQASKLRGNRVAFEFPSVGATENLLMAATLAQGETILENCAREPEIIDLARALKQMGAEIEGEGTETIHIQGKESLSGYEWQAMGDRIEAGTFLIGGFLTQGSVLVEGMAPEYLEAILVALEEAGAKIKRMENSISLEATSRPRAVDITTLPYPAFPTDMQAQFMALMSVADGASVITENIFENRFMHVPELNRLGADIKVKGKSSLIKGVERLKGAPLMATDLRASAGLVLAGLVAEGETTVRRIYHLDRGYEKMEEKLQALGASVERIQSTTA
jgi:UDP-N-acetylglucosamine 1-carboxyvinyltransferase